MNSPDESVREIGPAGANPAYEAIDGGDATRAIVFDTETTGIDPASDTVVEVAAVYVDLATQSITGQRSTLVNPGNVAISPQARAAHHLTDAELADAPTRAEALQYVLADDTTNGLFMGVAHYAEFDSPFLPELKCPWLCTWKMAKRIWPEAPAYGNQVLRYWLDLHPSLPHGMSPHRALYDALVTAEILLAALRTGRSPGRLLAGTMRPMLQQRITFGKHGPDRKVKGSVGLLWTEVPTGYLNYLMRDGIEDVDVAYTVGKELKRRGLA